MAKKKAESSVKKLSLKTVVLQDMVGKAVKGASQNKLIPLTSLMAIQLTDGKLTLITTDQTNTLYITHDKIEGDDFYCVVQVEQFSKLISRITSENTVLELDGSMLTVKANGNYKIELPFDEDGELIQYPDPLSEIELDDEPQTVNLSTIKTILNTNKAALPVKIEDPVYAGYYVSDKVITTDSFKICGFYANMLNEPTLISAEFMNLLDVITDDKISVWKIDDVLVFSTSNCVVYGYVMPGIEDYEIETMESLLDEEFESSCKVNKDDFLALLDRISLFVGEYDEHKVTLTFTDKGIDVSSKQSSGVETIEYYSHTNKSNYTCQINILELIQQIKANSADLIEIQFGNESSIKLVDGSIVQIISLC